MFFLPPLPASGLSSILPLLPLIDGTPTPHRGSVSIPLYQPEVVPFAFCLWPSSLNHSFITHQHHTPAGSGWTLEPSCGQNFLSLASGSPSSVEGMGYTACLI